MGQMPKLPVIFGHRGASALEPENTFRAFSRAFQDGALGIEFDLRATVNKELVIIHDATVDRTATNGSGRVKELTLAELRQFDFGFGEKIPTLEEVLKQYGNHYWLNIEIKEPALEKTLVDMLADLKVTKKIVISSFLSAPLKRLKELDATIPTALLFNNHSLNLRKVQQALHCDALHPHKSLISRSFLARARRFGFVIRTWTVDSRRVARKFAKLGVDAIITNNPKALLVALEGQK